MKTIKILAPLVVAAAAIFLLLQYGELISVIATKGLLFQVLSGICCWLLAGVSIACGVRLIAQYEGCDDYFLEEVSLHRSYSETSYQKILILSSFYIAMKFIECFFFYVLLDFQAWEWLSKSYYYFERIFLLIIFIYAIRLLYHYLSYLATRK